MHKAILVFALLATAGPAFAQPHPAAAASARVRIADLNLTSAIGAAELDRRIHAAVKLVCPAPKGQELAQLMAHKSCRTAATRSAIVQRDAALAAGQAEASIRVAAAR